jgi:hypothetical protein
VRLKNCGAWRKVSLTSEEVRGPWRKPKRLQFRTEVQAEALGANAKTGGIPK